MEKYCTLFHVAKNQLHLTPAPKTRSLSLWNSRLFVLFQFNSSNRFCELETIVFETKASWRISLRQLLYDGDISFAVTDSVDSVLFLRTENLAGDAGYSLQAMQHVKSNVFSSIANLVLVTFSRRSSHNYSLVHCTFLLYLDYPGKFKLSQAKKKAGLVTQAVPQGENCAAGGRKNGTG